MAETAPSHLRAALHLLVRALRRTGTGAPGPVAAPRRRLAAERGAISIDAARVERFRRLSGERPGGAAPELVPPVYASTWETALALELFASDELPVPTGGLVHLESELVVLRAIRVRDRVRCRVELDRADPHPRGLRLTLRSRNWNGAGQLCQEGSTVMLLRLGARPPRAAPASDGAPDEEASAEEWRMIDEWKLPANLGRRYARVSGDFNPIHLWRWSSRLLGYDRPILHGFCTEAMVAHALAERLWGGDATALRRLRIAFRAPLALPGRALLRVSGDGSKGRLRLVPPSDPHSRPYAEGEYLGG